MADLSPIHEGLGPDRYTNNKVSSQLVEYIASTWEH